MKVNPAVEEFLEHHGVKGMRWGVRKAGSTATGGARAVGRGAKAVSENHKQRKAEGRTIGQKWAKLTPQQKDKVLTSAALGGFAAVAIIQRHQNTKMTNVRAENSRRQIGDIGKMFNAAAGSGGIPGASRFNPSAGSGRMPSGTVKMPKAWAMPPVGKVRASDIKSTGRQIPPHLQARANAAVRAIRNAPSPSSLGITTPNV